jgi:predicted site-specific integrase-resolvase
MENTYNAAEAAKYLGFKVKTLQKWDREGRLIPAYRTKTNRRVYTQSQLDEFIGLRVQDTQTRVIAYCRVSSTAQKPDLANQIEILKEYCLKSGLSDVEFISEIGGGLNFERKKFLEIMNAVEQHKVKMLIIAHKDRLVRFGFEYFRYFLSKHNCELVILNDEKMSPEQEMVEDLMTIIHCFSSRLYGLRNYRKSLKEALR